MLVTAQGIQPQLGRDCFVAHSADIIGDVQSGDECSFWFQSVVRADVYPIRIGHQVNIQDGVVLHGTHQVCGVVLADRVSVGHKAILHGCQIGKNTLVGMGAIVMDHVKVGEECLIAAGSLLTPGKIFPSGYLIQGSPAKAVRPLTEAELKLVRGLADKYILYKSWYGGEK